MADSKITALTALTAADPANDMIPIVDVSDTPPASGNTKRISINNILACSPSATLASATITGDLTVDTSTLKVDSTNNRVGILTASPAQSLDVASGNFQVRTGGTVFSDTFSNYGAALSINAAGSLPIRLQIGGTNAYEITSGNIHTWSNVGGFAGTAMTLNSTGLGVGEAASVSRLQPRGSTSDSSAYILYGKAASGNVICFMRNDGRFLVGNGTTDNFIVTETGNVGIGVTPSAWQSSFKAIQTTGGVVGSNSATQYYVIQNAYLNTSGAWTYTTSAAATMFRQNAGAYEFFNENGTRVSGNPITWNQAMTLTATGDLLVGTTDATQTSGVGTKILGSGLGPYVVNAATTNSALAYTMYSTGAAAYRFYVGWAGTVFATNTTISAISDQRLKENVQDIDVGLGAILALKPRKFDWKAGKGKDIKGDRGFIAQEFEQVFPNLVDEWKDAAPEGEAPYKSVRQDLIPVLVKAIQELTARVQTLEAK